MVVVVVGVFVVHTVRAIMITCMHCSWADACHIHVVAIEVVVLDVADVVVVVVVVVVVGEAPSICSHVRDIMLVVVVVVVVECVRGMLSCGRRRR